MTTAPARVRPLLAGAAAVTAALLLTASPAPAAATPDPAAAGASVAHGCRPDLAAPKQQLRGVWIASVANLNWPSKPGLSVAQQQAELRSWYDLAVADHLNTVVVQIRPTADAFWPSRYEPWSQWLTGTQGKNPGYDPLAFAVREAHARNLDFEAWFNPYRISNQGDLNELAPNHPARRHPDWVMKYGDELYYDPGVPAARRFSEDAILDAVKRYDVDGVHFDDYFYPYPVEGESLPDQKTFARYGHGFSDVGDWRRHNVDLFVQEMDRRIHALKPWVKFGISPFGIWKNRSSDPRGSDTDGLESYGAIYADTRLWVKKHWIDYVNPQIYWEIGLPVADYAKLVPWWSSVVRGTGVQLYVGQADYKIGTSGAWLDQEELSRHLTFNRDYPEVGGDVHFSANDVRADKLGGVSTMVAEQYAHPAFVPAYPSLGGRAPNRPVGVHARRAGDGVTLRWRAGHGRAATSYAVYRFTGTRAPRCGFADATHLLATRRAAGGHARSFTDTTAVAGTRYTYYVTALDRLSVESRASAGATVR